MKHGYTILLFLFYLSVNSGIIAQNKSLLFNGTNNKVVIPDHDDLDFTTEFTLEAWIYANNWKSQAWQGSVINKDSEFSGIQSGYMIRIGADGKMEGIITPGWQGISTGSVMKEKTWNHVAMVFKDGELWLYINGKQEAHKTGLPTSVNKNNTNLQIGDSPGFPGRYWDGKIDEVRLWNKARTETDLVQYMSKSLEGNEAGLVAYYNFDEPDNSSTLTDITGNGHNGTLVNYASNYTWESGFELNQNDLAVTEIINPVSSSAWTNSERIQIKLQNLAFAPASGFDVSFEYNGKTYTETVTETIEAQKSFIYSFDKFINLTGKDEASIKASVLWDKDSNSENNTIQKSFTKTSTVRLMNQVQHNFSDKGQIHNRKVTLPDNNSMFSQLLLHISVSCPMSGCDPWDQAGNIKIKKDGKEYEIARFITPYRKACGPWTIDVTDFRSILKGEVDVVSFIQVWGASGWLLTVDLEYVSGEVANPFTQIVPLYELDGLVYGDPAKSYDLDERTVAIPSNTKSAQIRMTNTGHGQANTNNAAEFMEAYHHFWINGTEKFTHHLWKDDCNSNPCSPQSGTWQYARAGWCPGQGVTPVWYDLAEDLSPGADMTIDYVLQEYRNFLNTGYNSGSHTEPFYRIYSYLILSSDSAFAGYTDLIMDSVALTDSEIAGKQKIYMEIKNRGSVSVDNATIGYTISNSESVKNSIEINLEPGDTKIYEIEIDNFVDGQQGLLTAFADAQNDEVVSNNAKAIAFGGYTNIRENIISQNIKLFPNPVSGELNIESQELMKTIRFQTVDGKFIHELRPNSTKLSTNLSALDKGMYIIIVELGNNKIYTDKIIKK